MSSYAHTLQYLYGLQRRGIKFGLRNTRRLLKALGNPERTFASVHIAGTNGKGSTAAFMASIAMEAGLKTGLYTSPHLVRFTERIRINGVEIDEQRIVDYVRMLRPLIEKIQATFFEATTCIAFSHFAGEKVDLAVIETGLGGRLDSTNVVRPLVSVITNVSFDHTDVLGNTLASIAREKAGIIKPGTPCITACVERTALRVLQRTARNRGSKLWTLPEVTDVTRARSQTVLRYRDTVPVSLKPGLAGSAQITNASLAVAGMFLATEVRRAPQILRRALHRRVVERGLVRVCRNTGLRGRFETLGKPLRYIMDVAHNEAAMACLVAELQRRRCGYPVVVFGVMKDKAFKKMLGLLAHVARVIVAARPAIPRALTVGKLVAAAKACGIHALPAKSVADAVVRARRMAGRHGTVVVTGSHYVVGEAMQALDTKKP